MSDTIENPTADHLEAGGTISGTFDGLPFTDWPLTADGDWLTAGDDNQLNVREPNGRYCPAFTITSYTPPEPKPWWETCDDSTLIEAWYGGTREIRRARWWRNRAVNLDFIGRHPRRVLIADADTEVVVPKAAVDRLRRVHENPYSLACGIYHAIGDFLASVDEGDD